jgi:tetratricopeptide (TPR) repeat protein
MSGHLNQDQIALLRSFMPEGAVRALFLHLFECEDCRGRFLAPSVVPSGKVLPFAAPIVEEPLPPALDERFQRALRAGEAERSQARALAGELIQHPPRRWSMLVSNRPRYRSWAVAAQVLRQARERSFDDPREGEQLARLALEIAVRLDPAEYGERLILDLQARGHGVLGNALRLAGDLEGADQAFSRGVELLEETLDPLEEGDFLALLATLRRDQRRFEEAAALLSLAAEHYESVGAQDALARVLTKKASLHLDEGSPREALGPLEKALTLVPPERDLRTALAIHQNLTFCYLELGRVHEAERAFQQARRYHQRFPDRWARLRAWWLEGLLAAAAGRREDAERWLDQARNGYAEAGLDYDAAVVGLDLALLLAQSGRTAELKHLAGEMVPVFTSRKIHAEAQLALRFFDQAVRWEQAEAEVVARVGRFLRHSRLDAGLRFQP